MSRMGWLLALFLAFGASPGRGGEPSDRVNFLFVVQEGAYHWIVLDHSSLRGLVDPSRDLEDLTRLTEDMLWISLCGELTVEARQRVRARLEEMGPLEIRATSGVLGVEDWKPGEDSDNHALGPAALLRHIVPGEDGLRNLLRSLPRHGDSDTSVDSETGGTVRKAFLEAPPLLVVPIYGFTDVPGPLWARWQKGKAEGIGLQVFKDSERWGQEDALARGSQPPGWEKAR
ncbi:MAG: hypothetical protein FJ098_13020, partial [Deltaproteobacteria bacterium]|nr:hypothetical protein [Deltaproteobacteria bacterium]